MKGSQKKLVMLSIMALCVVACFYVGNQVYAGEQEGPQTAKKLTIGIYNKAANVTTYSVGNSWNDWLLWLVYDKLREPSPYVDTRENWLAEYVKPLSDDNRTWEIKLKDGIRWHDGTPLTAEDLAFTYIYYREGPSNRWTHHCSAVPRMEDVTVVDPLTVRVTSAKPMPNFDDVTAADLAIIQKKQWESVEEPLKFMDLPIGTGPYKLVDYKPDQYYRFVANEEYFMGKPLVDELMLVTIKDPSVMFTALKSGEIDGAARHLAPELLDQWIADPNIKVAESPSLWGVWANLNLGREPFIEKEMRQAISFALNPDPLLDTIMLGKGKSGTHGWPHPDAYWTKKGLSQPYDPEQAQTLLGQMGYVDTDGDGYRETPDGSTPDWNIIVSSNQPLYVRAAEMIVAQMADVGLKFHIDVMDPSTLSNTMYRTGEFDMSISDITPHGIADQDMLIILYKGDYGRELRHDPEKDAIVSRWFEASTREERFAVAAELQEYQNQYPHRLTLWYPKGLWAYRWKSYDNYQVSSGYGIFHKWSFLPNEVRGTTVSPK
jgi:peptide/nickel transport system substrate-binding protein